MGITPLYFVWTSDYLPFTDFPNHLARIKILKLYETSGFYRRYFFVDYFNGHLPIPNLIFDLFAVKLVPFVPVEAAGRLFLSLYVLLSILSVVLLAQETGADPEIALLGYLPVVYGLFFNMALLNFMFSIPLFTLALAFFLKYEKTGRIFFLIVLAGLAVLVYLCHLFSFFILAITLVAYGALSRFRKKAYIVGLSVLCAGVVVLYVSGNVLSFQNYSHWISYKLHLMPLYFLSYPVNYIDYNAGMLILVLYCGGIAWHSLAGRKVNRKFAMLGISFLVLYLVLPFSGISGTMIDARALPFAALMLLVSTDHLEKLRRLALIVLFVIVIAIKSYWSFSYYSSASRNFPEIRKCMDKMEAGAVLLPVCSAEGSNINPYTHSWGYEVLKKEFVTPYLFAGREQPLKFRQLLFAPSGLWGYKDEYDEEPSFWASLKNTYDYVLIIGNNSKLKKAVGKIGREVCGSEMAALYRVEGGIARHATPTGLGPAHE